MIIGRSRSGLLVFTSASVGYGCPVAEDMGLGKLPSSMNATPNRCDIMDRPAVNFVVPAGRHMSTEPLTLLFRTDSFISSMANGDTMSRTQPKPAFAGSGSARRGSA
jgi:hypothetical protein